MRSETDNPSCGAQAQLSRTTPPAMTPGAWLATRAVHATATTPASQASALRAFDGRKAAIRAPANGNTVSRVRVMAGRARPFVVGK